MSGLAGINGDIWFSTSPSTALGSPESCTDTGDHQHYFTVTHQAWDWSQTLTVQCSPNGTSGWSTVTDYTFYWPVGEVVFNSARVVGTNNYVRISVGNYFTLSSLSGGHAWKMSAKANTKDTTPFQSSGHWAQYTTTYKSMTFSVDMYNQDARMLNEMIKSGTGKINISGGIVVCQLWWDEANGKRWQFYALPTQVDTNIAANDVNKQVYQMQADGPVYLILSNTFNTTNVKQA